MTESQLSFCGIEEGGSTKEPRFSILPVPFDITTTYMGGTDKGPKAIIDASLNLELYDEELRMEPVSAGIETLPFLEPASTSGGAKASVDRVEEATASIIDKGRIPVIIGGEHSVSVGAVRALRSAYPGLSVLQLDAHADMRDSYEGERYSHASAARRISEFCPLVGAGIRSLSSEEADYLTSGETPNPITTVLAAEILNGDFSADKLLSGLSDEVYITIDLDVLDPAIMPSTGTPEPGGLSWYDLIGIIREVAGKRKVVGFDVVELSPIEGLVHPDFTAAKLLYKTIGYISESEKSLL